MGRIWLMPVLLLVWVWGAEIAEACSCARRSASCGPPADFWRAAAVFSGRITAVERVTDQNQRPTRQRQVRIRILEGFRGALTASSDVVIDTGPTCSYPFKIGQEYLIYAARQDDGRLTTTLCSGTMLLEHATGDLAYARNAATGHAPPGRIVGHVRQLPEHGSRGGPMTGITVAATRRGTSVVAASDARGRYTIELPSAGIYVLAVELPDTHYTPHSGKWIELSHGQACVATNIDVRFNGHVIGRVVDPSGRGVAGITVSHVRPARAGRPPAGRSRTLTNDAGTYRIERLPPGPFIVSVDLPSGNPRDETADGGEPGAIARHGTLGAGQRLSIEPLVLPPAVRVARLGGTVHTTDGAPAPGARVFLKSGDEEGHILGEPAVADALGRFVMAALVGERYEIFAERPGAERTSLRPEFSSHLALTVEPEMPPLRLTVRRRF